MTQARLLVAIFIAICTTVAVSPDDATKLETASVSDTVTADLSEDFQVSLQDSLTSDLGNALGELAGVVTDLAITVLDETISEESVNAALKEAWTAQAEQYDTNQDGGLSRDEASKIPDLRLDDDGNALSDEEFDAYLDEMFESVDLDKDGQITLPETKDYVHSITANVDEWVEKARTVLKPDHSAKAESDEEPSNIEPDE